MQFTEIDVSISTIKINDVDGTPQATNQMKLSMFQDALLASTLVASTPSL